MDVVAIFGLLEKGLRLLPTLVDAGVAIGGLVSRMVGVAEQAKNGQTVPLSELEALERDLDAALAEFNAPLPPDE